MPELARKKSFTSYKAIVSACLLILLMVAMSGGIGFYWPEFDDTEQKKVSKKLFADKAHNRQKTYLGHKEF